MSSSHAIKPKSDELNKSKPSNKKRPNKMNSDTSRVTSQEEMNAVIRETIITRVNNEPVIKDTNEITDDNIPVITDNSDRHIPATDNNIKIRSDNSVLALITNNLQDENRIPDKQGDTNNILVLKITVRYILKSQPII